MNKERFIAYMNQKLAVIKEEERKDIIDEYINHIDEKVQEGMNEEEVIAGFGDIDEMIKEILEAYNIDPRQTRGSDGFDRKVNDVLDTLFDGFQRLLSNVTSMDVDNIVRLMFEVLVVLIVLGILHIPFDIFASIGSSLLRSLFGFGIGTTFAWIWNLLVKVLYIVMFIVVLINVANRRWTHFKDKQDTSMMEDVKESFNFEQAKQAVHRFTGATSNKHYDTPYEENSDQQEQKTEEHTKATHIHERYSYQERTSYRDTQRESVFSLVLKFFGFLMMLPFIVAIVGLCCALGLLIVMSIQGFTVIGFYFIICGAITGCSAVITLIDRYLCRGGRR